MELTELYKTAQGLADILDLGMVSRIETESMAENERGWSGAAVIRRKVFFTDGTSAPMIFKLAERKERCAMKLLTEQKACSPVSYSYDILSDAPKWMAMEDLRQQESHDSGDERWLGRVAEKLASIHATNMGKETDMHWLPAADGAYWEHVVNGLSVAHFEKKMEQNPVFHREFGKYLPGLKEIGSQFAKEMTALYNEKDFLTLTHGDLQMRDGAHIYDCDGTPRIIDFGFCRYAPFYIDLAGWFTAGNLRLYYDALSAKGVTLEYSDFEKRAKMAFRYSGFIYLCPSVIAWQNGPTEKTGKRLLQALKIIFDGDFQERKINYSGELFQTLVEEHRR